MQTFSPTIISDDLFFLDIIVRTTAVKAFLTRYLECIASMYESKNLKRFLVFILIEKKMGKRPLPSFTSNTKLKFKKYLVEYSVILFGVTPY